MDQIENLYDESVATKNQIIRANLRLVVSIAKRYVAPANDIFELVSDGNMSLIRAVEKFDVSRGTRFCTYATAAILNKFRSQPSPPSCVAGPFRHQPRGNPERYRDIPAEPYAGGGDAAFARVVREASSPLPGRAGIADYSRGVSASSAQPEAAHVVIPYTVKCQFSVYIPGPTSHQLN